MRDSVTQRSRAVSPRPRRAWVAALAIFGLAGCDDGPTDLDFQVIEEVEFDESLDVDLAAMTKLSSGVYIRDLVVGPGDPAVYGVDLDTDYQGWLTDGTLFVDTHHVLRLATGQVPIGLEAGLLNIREGGVRQIIVPPEDGYGGIQHVGLNGTVVPGGSVLIYVVTLNEVS